MNNDFSFGKHLLVQVENPLWKVFLGNNVTSFTVRYLATPVAALQTLHHSLNNLLSHPIPPLALRGRKAQMVWDGASSHTINYWHRFRAFLSSKNNKKLQSWGKKYGYFEEWVDFAYWWSCIRKGTAQQACSSIRLFHLTTGNPYQSYRG